MEAAAASSWRKREREEGLGLAEASGVGGGLARRGGFRRTVLGGGGEAGSGGAAAGSITDRWRGPMGGLPSLPGGTGRRQGGGGDSLPAVPLPSLPLKSENLKEG